MCRSKQHCKIESKGILTSKDKDTRNPFVRPSTVMRTFRHSAQLGLVDLLNANKTYSNLLVTQSLVALLNAPKCFEVLVVVLVAPFLQSCVCVCVCVCGRVRTRSARDKYIDIGPLPLGVA